MTAGVHAQPAFLVRWATYFQERFPPLQYAVGLGAFAWAALAYARALRGEAGLAPPYPFLVGFAVTFLVFLQLRILDEFKDYEDDARFRSYRPVPRGLVTLRGLGNLWLAASAIEVALAASLGVLPLALLLLVLGYSGLMRAEFFVRRWLKAHALAYMASHMVIVPMIAAFIIACSGAVPAAADLAPFLAFSYLNFCVFELGRKVCAPAEERPGVETYSALWGPRHAAWAWVGALWAAGATGLWAAVRVDATWLYGLTASILAVAATAGALHFISSLERATGRTIKAISGLWLLGGHISLGAAITLAA